jgi:hypothetical protein
VAEGDFAIGSSTVLILFLQVSNPDFFVKTRMEAFEKLQHGRLAHGVLNQKHGLDARATRFFKDLNDEIRSLESMTNDEIPMTKRRGQLSVVRGQL